jgi:hypothetical protein
MREAKRLRVPLDIMLLCVRWYVAYALSLRNLEEIMQKRGGKCQYLWDRFCEDFRVAGDYVLNATAFGDQRLGRLLRR